VPLNVSCGFPQTSVVIITSEEVTTTSDHSLFITYFQQVKNIVKLFS
jgi:hypothetical protein